LRGIFYKHVPPRSETLFVPIIVTNVRLYTLAYHPSVISLETREFEDRDIISQAATPVDWVQFRKTFTAAAVSDPGDRSVFIVRATAIQNFLGQLQRPIAMPPQGGESLVVFR
jgi:hypothetical protein